ncbi:hypothetical protein HK097_009904 [Rhizophlyctis rosea]|uniref:Uncharacterized protein n=1 Tax=Rhizophlyctis rosea TaxID=64517 RepID=A0AAD5S9T9_9FUNG|nr:hypothetical protein HK097_009904 [Rhizophlyctis rosea]
MVVYKKKKTAMMTAEFNCYAQYPTPTATCMTLLTAPSLRSMSHNVAAVADFAFSIQVLFLDILFISSLYRRLSHIASSHHREILFGSRTLLQFILYVCILGSIVWNLVVKIMKVDFWQPGGQAWRFVESFIFITVAEFGMDVRKIIERCRREMIPRSGTGSSSLGSVDSAGSDGARRSGSMSYVGGGSQNSMQSTQIGSHSGVALVGGSGDKSARRWSGSGVEALRMVMRESALRDGVRMV